MHEWMWIAVVCEHMHWTYDEYLDNPNRFLDVIRIKLEEDGLYQKRQEAKAKRKK